MPVLSNAVALPHALAQAPALVAGLGRAVLLEPTGEIVEGDTNAVLAALGPRKPLVCHGPFQAKRLGMALPEGAFDLLELFVFVRPARFTVPSPKGLATALGLSAPQSLSEQATCLFSVARALLAELKASRDGDLPGLSWLVAKEGWAWGPSVLAALGDNQPTAAGQALALSVWERLPEWREDGPQTESKNLPVQPAEAVGRLAAIRPPKAEERPEQAAYASAASMAFEAAQNYGEPHVVLAEAGTGVGKTLGYIAPASLWAERNEAPVWISTYTRNLQRQVDEELEHLFPNPQEKARRVVVRKGRENYLCLLNFEERTGGAQTMMSLNPRERITLAILARWAQATRSGDLVGGDLPGWFFDLMGTLPVTDLTDRRGECIYGACPHYRKCFVERNARNAKRADLVIANHALVMVQTALGGADAGDMSLMGQARPVVTESDDGEESKEATSSLPLRYVFDEGHHLFDAADSAFSAILSGQEAFDLKRWLVGAGNDQGPGKKSRARGIAARLDGIRISDEFAPEAGQTRTLRKAVDAVARKASVLPQDGWHQRLQSSLPQNALERFLMAAASQVYARAERPGDPYDIECDVVPPLDALTEAAKELLADLIALIEPLEQFAAGLKTLLTGDGRALESEDRRRTEALAQTLQRRALMPLKAWQHMLDDLENGMDREALIDRLAVMRSFGRDRDVAFLRNNLDPMAPFMSSISFTAHGALITSATLRDISDDVEMDWQRAEQRTGAKHLSKPAIRSTVTSPFDYGAQTRVLAVNDVRKDDLDQVGAAFRDLFLASGGGALGIFTAITRLRAVQKRLVSPMEDKGLELYAQHVDPLDVATLIDLFRAEKDSCLLGTDAVRDGIDVPGDSLRLLVFDRVPWPRPDILLRERKKAFGGQQYTDMLVRLKLRQAFGRLVRKATDRGVFVLLDPMMPSRFASAFPEGVTLERVGIAEAIRITESH